MRDKDYPELLDLLNIGVTVVGERDHRIWRANRAAGEIYGIEPARLVGMTWDELAPPENLELWRRTQVEQVASGQRQSRRLLRFTRPDGEIAHVLLTAILIDDVPEPYFVGQIQDITEHTRTDAYLQLVLENTPVSMFAFDPAGRVLAAAGAAADEAAAGLEAARTSSLFEEFADIPQAMALVRSSLRGERVSGVLEAFGRSLDVHLVPIRDADGPVSTVTAVATDITERQRTLATLRLRAAEQAVVADLGQLALDGSDSADLWRRASAALAERLGQVRVEIHELDDRGARRGLLARASGTADAFQAGAEPTLTMDAGRPAHPLARVELYRPAGCGSFAEDELRFARSVVTVLGLAALRFQMEGQIRHQAMHDGLTGLPNRAALLDHLARMAHRARRDRRHIGVLFIDLDGFKTVNDTLGHQAGDDLLRQTAHRLERAVRPGDVVGRLAGDEFAVLCENIDSVGTLETIADRILVALSEPVRVDGHALTLSASIGIALSATTTSDGEELLNDADIAMYTAKRRGPGRRLSFDSAMRDQLVEQVARTEDLRPALASDQLVARYEPICDITGERVGVQARPHWRHPTRGLLPPAEFLPGADQPGPRIPIDRWLLEASCRAAADWPPAAGARQPPLLDVGVCGALLLETTFLSDLDRLLRATGAGERYRLCLEIAEEEVPRDRTGLVETMFAVRDLGVLVCVAGYGTRRRDSGSLPFDVLRLHASFVRRIGDPYERAAASAITHFAHRLDLRVLAGEVRTREQLRILRDLGCDLVQGPVLDPVPADPAFS